MAAFMHSQALLKDIAVAGGMIAACHSRARPAFGRRDGGQRARQRKLGT